MKDESSAYLVNGIPNGSISPSDRGLLYGDGIFETMLAVNGKIPFLPEHLERLKRGCGYLSIPLPEKEIILKEVGILLNDFAIPGETENGNALSIAENNFISARKCIIKIIITRGESERGYAFSENSRPTRVLSRHNLPANYEKRQNEGVALEFAKRSISCPEGFSGIKHTNRLEYILARNEIQDSSVYDMILKNSAGHITETTSSNIFWIKDQILYTPDLSHCGLKGIMRDFVLKTSEKLKLPAAEENFTEEDLLSAEEVFITNAVTGILPVVQIGGRSYSKNGHTAKFQPGRLADKFQDSFFNKINQ